MGVEVFDACALLALVNSEQGGVLVESLLNDSASTCSVHSINLCEVYYQLLHAADVPTSVQVIDDLLAFGLIVREDMGRSFWREVGWLKARGRIALPDCFFLATAIHLGVRVVTSEHGEFDPIVPLGLCPILFIR